MFSCKLRKFMQANGLNCALRSSQTCIPSQFEPMNILKIQILLVPCVTYSIKGTMNKLCPRLFIIIFTDVYRKSKYIPTVTNFASILANSFYFLRKIITLRPSVLNFWGRLVKFCQKCFVKKWLCWSWFTKKGTQNLCSAHISSAAWKLPSTWPRYLR